MSESVCVCASVHNESGFVERKVIYLKCTQKELLRLSDQSQPERIGHSCLCIISTTHTGTKSQYSAIQNRLHNQGWVCVFVCVCMDGWMQREEERRRKLTISKWKSKCMCTHVCMKYSPFPLYFLVSSLKKPVFYQHKAVLHFPFEDVMNLQMQSQTAPS